MMMNQFVYHVKCMTCTKCSHGTENSTKCGWGLHLAVAVSGCVLVALWLIGRGLDYTLPYPILYPCLLLLLSWHALQPFSTASISACLPPMCSMPAPLCIHVTTWHPLTDQC